MERDAAAGQRTPRAVFQVAADRTPDLRELGADLVVTPRQQLHLDERIVGPRPQRFVTQARLLGAGLRPVAGPRAVGAGVAQDVVAQFAAFGVGRPFGQGPVDLADAALADHLVEPRQGLRGLGEQHRAAHRTVDAVHHAEEHVAGLGVAAFDKGLYLVFERAFARRIGLHQIAAVFIDDQQMIVFVEDIFGSEHFSGISKSGLYFNATFLRRRRAAPPKPVSRTCSLRIRART